MKRTSHKGTEIHVEGLYTLLRTVGKMGKEASDHARVVSTDIAEDFLMAVRMAANTEPERIAASFIRVYRDRVPKVGFAAGRRVKGVSGNPTIAEFFYGTEFGGPSSFARGGERFRDHTGTEGYFFYPTLRSQGRKMADDWFDAIEDLLEVDWNKGAARARAGGD